MSQVKASSNAPKALIIEPSKELAEQTLNNVKQFRKYVDNPKLRYDSLHRDGADIKQHKWHRLCLRVGMGIFRQVTIIIQLLVVVK